ncbi:hypothetical protein M3172_14500 [Mesobacillus subterraneus]|uniref:hypothetical protein n=1 Tax=Mesobacillus subterraneus TaxID=285983 RepID=UPI002041C81C|nr:hypothetical protein [Mesobacillus subterraneus]MCM3574403.1 hypothetical protein [Mesobacillus subterraneus]
MFHKSYKVWFSILLIWTIISPSAKLFNLQIFKGLLLLTGISLIIQIAFDKNFKFKSWNLVILLLYILIISLGYLIGIIKGFHETAYEEYLAFLAPVFIISLYQKKYISKHHVIKIIFYSVLTYSILKVIIAILISLNIFHFNDFSNFTAKTFNMSFISYPMHLNLNIYRIYYVNDFLVSIMPLFLLKDKVKLKKELKPLFIAIFTLSILLSYSRFLIILYVFLVLVSVTRRTLWLKESKDKTIINLIKIFIIILISIWLLNKSMIIDLASSRFYLEDNYSADTIREQQFGVLRDMLVNNIWTGFGIGSYDKSFIRSENLFSYELQWLSFASKFGIPLFTAFIFVIFLYIKKNVFLNSQSLLILSAVFSVGFFNPYLQSQIFGVVLLVIMIFYDKEMKNTQTKTD